MAERIRTHICQKDSLALDRTIDFALAFWSAHEVPDLGKLLAEVHACLVPEGRFLVVELRGHVTPQDMAEMTAKAERAGFAATEAGPYASWSHTVIYRKG